MLMDKSHLVAEIEFWREMIERNHSSVSAQAMERMRMALALAERKLAKSAGPLEATAGHGQCETIPVNQGEVH